MSRARNDQTSLKFHVSYIRKKKKRSIQNMGDSKTLENARSGAMSQNKVKRARAPSRPLMSKNVLPLKLESVISISISNLITPEL
jgi:hypothetical protein